MVMGFWLRSSSHRAADIEYNYGTWTKEHIDSLINPRVIFNYESIVCCFVLEKRWRLCGCDAGQTRRRSGPARIITPLHTLSQSCCCDSASNFVGSTLGSAAVSVKVL